MACVVLEALDDQVLVALRHLIVEERERVWQQIFKNYEDK
jgi:hypothetical protein